MRAQEFIIEYKISARKHRKGVTVVATDDKGKQIGIAELEYHLPGVPEYEKTIQATRLSVEPKYQRQGIAQAMYDLLKSRGYKIFRSGDQSFDGAKFWNKHRGEEATVWETNTQRQQLDFDKIYGKYLKVTDNSGDPGKPGFSLVTPLNGDSWNWRERPEFIPVVKKKLNQPGWLPNHKYQQIIDSMAGKEFDPAKHIATEDTEDYAGLQLRLSKDSDGVAVRALASGKELGMAEFFFDDQGRLDPQTVWVDERYHGQGIAAAMYDYLKDKGYTIVRSWDQTDAGKGFWDKHRGEEATVWENFADGKKPGRKGLSKRVGIPKKATLGQLEKIAKSSTGEKRRMAQWQLNMRRGRAKKNK